MSDFISSMQTQIMGWAAPLQTAVTTILTGFIVIGAGFIIYKLLMKSFKFGSRG